MLLPTPTPGHPAPCLEQVDATHVRWQGRELLFFAGNDYHRFSRHPAVLQAFQEAAERFGIAAAGSRITTANHPLHEELESALARHLTIEAALLLPTGFAAGSALVHALRDLGALFLARPCHLCLEQAARAADRPVTRFPARDPEALAAEASTLPPGRGVVVLTDGVDPGTGRLAPLAGYAAALQDRPVILAVDDAHGTGTVGPNGRGSWAEAGLAPEGVAVCGTLSKALGAFGGFVAGSREVVARVLDAPCFVGGTPIGPPLAAAGLAALGILEREPERISRLQASARDLKAAAAAAGYPQADGVAPILSLPAADPEAMAAHLVERGIFPAYVRYPGAPGGGHFRLTLSSAHTEEDLDTLRRALHGST